MAVEGMCVAHGKTVSNSMSLTGARTPARVHSQQLNTQHQSRLNSQQSLLRMLVKSVITTHEQ